MTAQITVNVPEELASQLRPLEDELPQILELGLRQWNARLDGTFAGLADVLETLAGLPAPQEILALRPSPDLQNRIHELLEKNRAARLAPEEEREWQQYEFVEHLVRVAKARAALKLRQDGNANEQDLHSR